MHKFSLFLLALAASALSGCFSREEPFYEEAQVIQDARIAGEYSNTMLGSESSSHGPPWVISPSADFPGKYEITIQEGGTAVTLLGTLFRLDKILFLDLFPLSDSGVYHVGGSVTLTEMIRLAMYKPLHVIWKVELSESEIGYHFPFGGGVGAALKKAPELVAEPKDSPSRIVLAGSAKEAQKFLLRFADDPMVFNYKGKLNKTKVNSGQTSTPTNASQPFISATNQTPPEENSRRKQLVPPGKSP